MISTVLIVILGALAILVAFSVLKKLFKLAFSALLLALLVAGLWYLMQEDPSQARETLRGVAEDAMTKAGEVAEEGAEVVRERAGPTLDKAGEVVRERVTRARETVGEVVDGVASEGAEEAPETPGARAAAGEDDGSR